MDARSLGTLQGNFNAISSLWLETTQNDYVGGASAEAQAYKGKLTQHLHGNLQASLGELVDYAAGYTDMTKSVPQRRQAVDFLLAQGLESPKVDSAIQLATLEAFDAINVKMGVAAISDSAFNRLASFPARDEAVAARRSEVVGALAPKLGSKARPVSLQAA